LAVELFTVIMWSDHIRNPNWDYEVKSDQYTHRFLPGFVYFWIVVNLSTSGQKAKATHWFLLILV